MWMHIFVGEKVGQVEVIKRLGGGLMLYNTGGFKKKKKKRRDRRKFSFRIIRERGGFIVIHDTTLESQFNQTQHRRDT